MGERVCFAANRYNAGMDNEVVLLGIRHWDVQMHTQMAAYQAAYGTEYFDFETEEQGFLTNRNRFVDRKEAFSIALSQNQLLWLEGWNKFNPEEQTGVLYSENLW